MQPTIAATSVPPYSPQIDPPTKPKRGNDAGCAKKVGLTKVCRNACGTPTASAIPSRPPTSHQASTTATAIIATPSAGLGGQRSAVEPAAAIEKITPNSSPNKPPSSTPCS